jgi:hypothetical protein
VAFVEREIAKQQVFGVLENQQIGVVCRDSDG